MKQITIYELLPFLKHGFCVFTRSGNWIFYRKKPEIISFINFFGNKAERWQTTGFGTNLSEMFNITPFAGDWKDSLMKCGGQDAIIKTPVGDIATTSFSPSDVCIDPKIKEFSFTAELINGVKIAFEKIPNNAGLTDKQLTTFFEDLFGIKEIKK